MNQCQEINQCLRAACSVMNDTSLDPMQHPADMCSCGLQGPETSVQCTAKHAEDNDSSHKPVPGCPPAEPEDHRVMHSDNAGQ